MHSTRNFFYQVFIKLLLVVLSFVKIHKKLIYRCCSLQTPERMKIYQENTQILPELEIFDSVNGFDEEETKKQLKSSNLKFISLDDGYETYGTLANFLTKYYCLKYQIDNEVEYMCFLEDDMILSKNFKKFTEKIVVLFTIMPKLNMVRLGKWGEGYITSLKGAKRITRIIENEGIKRNIDNQLRLDCGFEMCAKRFTPWKLVIHTNNGDCLKTSRIRGAL